MRGREAQEREAAWRRGRERQAAGATGHAGGPSGADPELARYAFAALAENVRDYAIFLMDADAIIRFWGEGAHLLKRWTREQVEGGHLRLLYPDGGAEDGTAEAHLRDAAEHGEYVGQGHRVRGDGTVFWAQVTLTALRTAGGTLHGFSKVTRDLTTRHAVEAAVALRVKLAELDAAHGERENLRAEIAVLKEELAVLNRELGNPGSRIG